MSKIFHAYDIRGVYGDELDEGIAYLIGRAMATYLKSSPILVGRDMRESSVPLRDALVRGIMDQGADVVDIGLCSSSMFYWVAQRYGASVMVTASHNPAKYNGFKFCRDGAAPVGELTGLREIETLVLENTFTTPEHKGTYAQDDLIEAYLQFTLTFLKAKRPFRVVIDAANGMGGYTYGALIKKLPSNISIIPMYFELDGNFPNHEANPLKLVTLKDLQERVVRENADFGVALDGDEDRIVFVDNKGKPVMNDVTTALLARQVLSEQPGATILYDIRQSRVAPEEITVAGGKPVMTRVGHSFIKVAMREHKAAFGGELSGHFYNAEQQGAENTQIVFFRMLNLLDSEGKSLADIADPLAHRYAKIEETNFTVKDPKAVIERFAKEYEHAEGVQSATSMDGVRVDFAEWWFNLRASNTEPLLRLNLEAKDPAMLQHKLEEMTAKITSYANQ